MNGRPFKFGEQVALDHAVEEREARQRELADASAALDAALAELGRRRSAWSRAQEQARAAAAELARPARSTGLAHVHASLLLESRRDAEALAAEALADQGVVVRAARTLVDERLAALGAADARVKALEELRDRQRAAFERDRARREEAERDDAAIQARVRRSPPP